MECDLMWYENKIEITMGTHSQNFIGENSFRGVGGCGCKKKWC
jgi:hypothetical protein